MRACVKHCRMVVGWVAAWMLLSAQVQAWQAPTIEPEAEAILRKLFPADAAPETIRTDATVVMELKGTGANQKKSATYTVAAERPNRISAQSRSKDAAQVVCDGKQLYVFVPDMGKYTLADAPSDMAAVVGDSNVRMGVVVSPLLRVALVGAVPYEQWIQGASGIQLAGTARLGAAKCDKVVVATESYDLELWVDQADEPRLRKATADLNKLVAAMVGMPVPGLECTATITTKKARTEKISESDFAIDPPTDATKVASLEMPKPNQTAGPQVLLGQAAPPAQMALLGGGSMNLAAHQGKEVVILDFWATWCGPCVASLPQIAEVAAAYRERGVAFYAVNLQEEPDAILKFLQEKQLNIPVALDSNGRVGGAYLARAIPQTVIIGKDGTVQVVHVGASANLKTQLAGELEALLAGQRLAP